MKNIICWQVFLTSHHGVMVYTHLMMHMRGDTDCITHSLAHSVVHSFTHSLMHPLTRMSRKADMSSVSQCQLSLVCLLWCATWSEGVDWLTIWPFSLLQALSLVFGGDLRIGF